MKFAVYYDTMVLVTNENAVPTLIELNYYILGGDREENQSYKWHFNRAIPYLSDIYKIEIDKNRAYLIGNNIHFIYKHGIYSEFTHNVEILLYEFVDRDMIGMMQMSNLGIFGYIPHISTLYYYTLTRNGIVIYQLEE